MNLTAPITDVSDQAARLRALVSASSSPVPSANACPVIALASGKGGVGKTVISVNLAIALASRGKRVTLLDADLGTANADLMLGVTTGRRLEDALSPTPTTPTSDAVRTDPLASISAEVRPGLRLIPGAARLTQLSPSQREVLCRGLEAAARSSDCVLIDTGAGIGPSVLGFLDLADLVAVIATPEPTSIADAYALIKQRCLDETTRAPIGIIVNEARDKAEAANVHGRINLVATRFLGRSIPLLGWIPKDEAIPRSVCQRTPLLEAAPSSPAAQFVRDLSDVMLSMARGAVERKRDSGPNFWSRFRGSFP